MIVGFGFINEDLRRKYSTSATSPLVAEVANMGHGMSRLVTVVMQVKALEVR